MPSKKAFMVAALIYIIIGVALIVLVMSIFGKAMAFFGARNDAKYDNSFQTFVDEINRMNPGKETFTLQLKDKSAVIGFQQDTQKFECQTCFFEGLSTPFVVNKPTVTECSTPKTACLCLCFGMEFQNQQAVCSSPIKCKSLVKDLSGSFIVGETISAWSGTIPRSWYNNQLTLESNSGFMLSNNVANSPDLFRGREVNHLYVQKDAARIGICTQQVLTVHQNFIGKDSCIITEYDLAQKLELAAANTTNPVAVDPNLMINLYSEFAKKYPNDWYAEVALIKAIELCIQPNVNQKAKALELLDILKTKENEFNKEKIAQLRTRANALP